MSVSSVDGHWQVLDDLALDPHPVVRLQPVLGCGALKPVWRDPLGALLN